MTHNSYIMEPGCSFFSFNRNYNYKLLLGFCPRNRAGEGNTSEVYSSASRCYRQHKYKKTKTIRRERNRNKKRRI